MKSASPGANRRTARKIHPLPLRKPVPSALAVALEFHHAPAALRADQIEDRGNDAGTGFTRNRCNCPHSSLPSHSENCLTILWDASGMPTLDVSNCDKLIAA